MTHSTTRTASAGSITAMTNNSVGLAVWTSTFPNRIRQSAADHPQDDPDGEEYNRRHGILSFPKFLDLLSHADIDQRS
jgi:hypothetical protein